MCRTLIILAVSLALCLPAGCSSTKSSQARGEHVQADPSIRALPIQQNTTPSVRLNYVYLTLDAETMDAINQSQFIRDRFALFGQSTPDPTAVNAGEATYLLGENTCIELLAAPQSQQETEGNAGICFSTRKPGQIDIVYDNLRARLGTNVYKGLTTFDTGDEHIPWLYYVSSHSVEQVPSLLTWVTEHDPAFHKTVGPNSDCRLPEPQHTGQHSEPQNLFRKIISVTLDLTQSEFDHLYAELSAYGYSISEQHGLTLFTSPDIQIRAAVMPNPQYRIRTIRCSLTSIPEEPTKMTFGSKATLTLNQDATAIWTFGQRQTAFVHK